MPKKKVKEVLEDVAVALEEEVVAVEEKPKAKKGDSEAKKAFQITIDNYKKYSPEKYEAKKEALEAKLNTL